MSMNKEMFNYWLLNDEDIETNIRSFNLNFGPQHPAAHGVLRVVIQLRGEVIERSDVHIGLLHRGTEKLLETRLYTLGLPYFDRLDYTAIMLQEHAYCLAIEDLIGSRNYLNIYTNVRIIFDELTRILNHLIALSTHAMDVGTMAIFFWAFEERERIMEFYERVSGARMHAAFYRPNDASIGYIFNSLVKDIVFFCRDLLKRLGQMDSKLMSSSIWRARLSEIGIINVEFLKKWGVTGPLARSTGVKSDLRISYTETYESYYYLNIRSFLGENGDCFDRFLIRMREMSESVYIILQVINRWVYEWQNMRELSFLIDNRNKYEFQKHFNSEWCTSMEDLIIHFKGCSEGYSVPRGITYAAVESAKGEFGVLLVADGSAKPYRCRIRSPAYYHTQLFTPMVQGHYFADLITIIGSQDIVMGEVDR